MDPDFGAFDCMDSSDLAGARLASLQLDALRELERTTQQPSSLDEDVVEDWRIWREALSVALVTAIQKREA